MKLKKFIGVLFGACTLAMLAGCYEPLDITDSEMDMVAEYAAGVLVKHGTNATDALLNREEQEEAFAKLATPTPRPTYAPAKEDKEHPVLKALKEYPALKVRTAPMGCPAAEEPQAFHIRS